VRNCGSAGDKLCQHRPVKGQVDKALGPCKMKTNANIADAAINVHLTYYLHGSPSSENKQGAIRQFDRSTLDHGRIVAKPLCKFAQECIHGIVKDRCQKPSVRYEHDVRGMSET
jgi:hypothetical protein